MSTDIKHNQNDTPQQEAKAVENLTQQSLNHSQGASDALAAELNKLSTENPAFIQQVQAQMRADEAANSSLPHITLNYDSEHTFGNYTNGSSIGESAFKDSPDGKKTTELVAGSTYTVYANQGSFQKGAFVDVQGPETLRNIAGNTIEPAQQRKLARLE